MPIMRNLLRHFIFGHNSTLYLRKGIKRAYRNHFKSSPTPLLKAMKVKAALLIKENKDLVIDAPSIGHVEFSCHLLASYQALLPQFDNDTTKTVEFIKKATFDVFDSWLLNVSFNKIFAKSKNDLSMLNSVFSWMMKQYGKSFSWRATLEPNYFDITITRCFYFEFFKKYQALFLMPILCHLDSIWFNKIDVKKHGFEFDESNYQTQGYGARECVFPIKKHSL